MVVSKKRYFKLFIIFAIVFCSIFFAGCSCDFTFDFDKDNNSNIETPFITADLKAKKLQWYAQDATTVYDVYVNDTVKTINSHNDIITFDYSTYLKENIVYTFSVVAKSFNDNSSDSVKSNEISIDNTLNGLNTTKTSQYTITNKEPLVITPTINSNNVINWAQVDGATKYLVSLYANRTGYMEYITNQTSLDLAYINLTQQNGSVLYPHEIIFYNIHTITDEDNKVAELVSPKINYFNPDEKGMDKYTEFAFDGYIWDNYINSKEELNANVYYNFISRQKSYNLYFDTNYSAGKNINNDISDSLNSFYETSYYGTQDGYGQNYSKLTNADKNMYTVAIKFFGTDECNTDIQPVTSQLLNAQDTGLAYYENYDFEANGKRADTYDDFVSDKYLLAQSVTTSEQLYHAVENNVTPIINNPDSRAGLIYAEAKKVLREIISDNMTDYEKALSIFDWITHNTIYDYSSTSNKKADYFTELCCYYLEGVFLQKIDVGGVQKGVAVCDGFSKAYSLLCNMEGIECIRIVGDAKTGTGTGGHAWNKVKLGDEYYLVDITWTELISNKTELLSHKYFLTGDYLVSNTHFAYDNRDKFSLYPTKLDPTINYYKDTKISYIDASGDTKELDLFIDNDANLIDALDANLYNNTSFVEVAFEYEYLDSLMASYNNDDDTTNNVETVLDALAKTMKAGKYKAQLISQYYDSTGGYLNVLPISADEQIAVALFETSLLANIDKDTEAEEDELVDIINMYASYAIKNEDVLATSTSGYEILVGIDEEYLLTKSNSTLSKFFTYAEVENALNIILANLDNDIKCEYSLQCLKKVEEMYINSSTESTKVFYFTLKVNTTYANTLASPQATLDAEAKTITWNAIEFANKYEIYINDVKVETIIANAEEEYCYTFTITGFKKYDIVIKAITDKDGYINSQSNVITFVALATPVVNQSGAQLTWQSVDNATKYIVYNAQNNIIETINKEDVNEGIYTFSFDSTNVEAGSHTAYVVAVYEDSTYLYTSNNSSVITFVKLTAPTVSIIGTQIHWAPIDNAEEYLIYINNTVQDVNDVISENSSGYTINLALLNATQEAGIYSIKVQACNSGKGYGDSNYSNIVKYTKLSAPTIYFEGTTLKWGAIYSITGYVINVTNTLDSSTKTISIGSNSTQYNLSNTITEAGEYKVCVSAINSNNGYGAGTSNDLNYSKLSVPAITFDSNGVVSWQTISNADKYSITYNSKTQDISNTATSFAISDTLNAGSYPITLKALSTKNGVDSSNTSQPITFVQLGAPILTFNASKLTWNEVANASGYQVYINDYLATQTSLEYECKALSAGTYSTIHVKAINTNSSEVLYYNPKVSSNISFTKLSQLSAPIISDSIVSWEQDSNAVEYYLYVDDEHKATIKGSNNTQYDLVNLSLSANGDNAKEYSIQVQAINTNNGYASGEISDSTTYTKLPPMSAPSNVRFSDADNNIITWDPVNDASGYNIYWNGTKINNTPISNLTYTLTLSGLIITAGVDYNVQVQTLASSADRDDSNLSSSFVTYHQLATPTNLQFSNITSTSLTLSWSAVAHANLYMICKNETMNEPTSNTSISSLSISNPNITYTFTVAALGYNTDTAKYIQSAEGSITYSTTLETPTNLNINYDTNILTWDAVNGATTYNVIIDNNTSSPIVVSTNSLDLDNYIADYTKHSIYIIASSNINKDSDASDTIEYQQTSLDTLTVTTTNTSNTSSATTLYINPLLAPEVTINRGSVDGISDDTLTWEIIPQASSYTVIITTDAPEYVAGTTYSIAHTNHIFSNILSNSLDLSNYYNTLGITDEYEIVAYTVLSQVGTKLYAMDFDTDYYNPYYDGGTYDIVYAFDGEFNDFYIQSQDELNNLIYYSHTSRISSFTFKTALSSGIVDPNDVDDNPNDDQPKYNIYISVAVELAIDFIAGTKYLGYGSITNIYSSYAITNFSLTFKEGVHDGDTQCNLNFYDKYNTEELYYQQNSYSLNLPYYKNYNFDANGKRDNIYNNFSSDQKAIRVLVSTSEELFYAIENGFTPICQTGSRAELIYNKAKQTLREIISDNMSDYEKALSIADWITVNTSYDYTALTIEDIAKEYGDENFKISYQECPAFYLEGVFINKLAVCDGFSKAYSLMCNMEGIECIRITGHANSEGHAWNKVKINNKYYVVDITWFTILLENDLIEEFYNHKYCFTTDAEIESTHTPLDSRSRFNYYPTADTPIYYSSYSFNAEINEDTLTHNAIISNDDDLKELLYIWGINKYTAVDIIVDEDYINAIHNNYKASSPSISINYAFIKYLMQTIANNAYIKAYYYGDGTLYIPITMETSYAEDKNGNIITIVNLPITASDQDEY